MLAGNEGNSLLTIAVAPLGRWVSVTSPRIEPVVEGVAARVGCEVNVEVGNPAAENVQVHQLGPGHFSEGSRDQGEHGAQGTGLIALQVGDMRHVAFWFEVRETRDLSFRGDGESPMGILPDLNAR